MKLFGLNITRAAAAPRPAQRSLSPDVAAWLTGSDSSPSPSLSNAYEQVVWVYRAVTILAEQIANIPFLFSAGERGRENLITSGPLLHFYNQPHPHINRFQYWELRVLWLMLRGECIRIPIYRDQAGTLSLASGVPVDMPTPTLHQRSQLFAATETTARPAERQKPTIKTILILDPARFTHIIQNNRLAGWRYNGGPQEPLDSQVFLPEEIWFEKLPNPFDFWRGLPPLCVAGLAAKTDFAASSFMRGLIDNNAENGLIVRTDQQLSDEQREQISAALRDRKRRAGAADRSVLLWGTSEIVQPQLTSADLQFLENRKFSRAEICAAFGVPEEIVTSTDHAKYDVMQGARLNFIENRIAPLCARLEAEEQKTVRLLDPNAVGWFDLDSLPIMQAARRTRLAAAKAGFDMGIPFNELNRVFDLGFRSLPWGDSGYVPANLQNLGQSEGQEGPPPRSEGRGRPRPRSSPDPSEAQGEPPPRPSADESLAALRRIAASLPAPQSSPEPVPGPAPRSPEITTAPGLPATTQNLQHPAPGSTALASAETALADLPALIDRSLHLLQEMAKHEKPT
ncbi:MAG TPA: phage portal protein [Candidatus Acidoferrum sp.]|jgi:HK97 family phage portal protein|nr:phage portal protein [Candidatus Acidoferrum sp.]